MFSNWMMKYPSERCFNIKMSSYKYRNSHNKDKIDGLVQQRCNSIADALELHLFALTHRVGPMTMISNPEACGWINRMNLPSWDIWLIHHTKIKKLQKWNKVTLAKSYMLINYHGLYCKTLPAIPGSLLYGLLSHSKDPSSGCFVGIWCHFWDHLSPTDYIEGITKHIVQLIVLFGLITMIAPLLEKQNWKNLINRSYISSMNW